MFWSFWRKGSAVMISRDPPGVVLPGWGHMDLFPAAKGRTSAADSRTMTVQKWLACQLGRPRGNRLPTGGVLLPVLYPLCLHRIPIRVEKKFGMIIRESPGIPAEKNTGWIKKNPKNPSCLPPAHHLLPLPPPPLRGARVGSDGARGSAGALLRAGARAPNLWGA